MKNGKDEKLSELFSAYTSEEKIARYKRDEQGERVYE